MTTITTLVRHHEHRDLVGVVIAAMESGGETHRFQILRKCGRNRLQLETERVGNRDHVMFEFGRYVQQCRLDADEHFVLLRDESQS